MQYFCKNLERRLQVSKSTTESGLNPINGIDYLEVISYDQKTLKVHFIHPLPGEIGGVPDGTGIDPLDHNNLVIEGGVRIQNIKVVDANPDSSTGSDGRDLIVKVDNAGDFSFYILRLVISPSDLEVPQGFDPQLAQVEFSFKAGCPSEFDCKVEDDCLPEPIFEPRINYLAKDFSSFRRLALDRLSLLMPDWQERNVADLQIALVELMAYTGDYLSYYQDAVGTEAYLYKSRKRTSVRRHARLLDYHVHDGCNARTWISIEVEDSGNADTAILNKGTTFITKSTDNTVVVDDAGLNKVFREPNIHIFESKHDLTLYYVHNEIEFYTWDDSACCLPKGATKATFYRKDQLDLLLEPGQVVVFEEIKSPTTGRPADSDPLNRHAVRLMKVEKNIDVLYGINVVEVTWHEEDALPFPLCISSTKDDVVIENISIARGNIVLADHGFTKEIEILKPDTAPEEGNYRPLLPDVGITISTPYDHTENIGNPASIMLVQNPHEAIAEILLFEEDDIWKAQRDLLGSDRFRQEFVAEIETNQIVRLRFGDDILGKKPGEGFRPKAKYRLGNGRYGNIGAEAIGRINWNSDGILKVRNPLPATGGQNAETIEEVKQFAPEAFKTQERSVTEADYISKTELHPQVQTALAKFRWTGSWYTVYLTIDRKDGKLLDAAFREEIIDHLEKYRMAGYDLDISPPRFVPVEIEMNVCVKGGYFRNDIKRKLQSVFSRTLLPGGAKGFFHPDNFTFGQPIYLSAIYQKAMAIDGVDSVELKTFKRLGKTANLEKQNGILKPAETEILRLDNDPNFPENGKINFLMYGGL